MKRLICDVCKEEYQEVTLDTEMRFLQGSFYLAPVLDICPECYNTIYKSVGECIFNKINDILHGRC